MALQFKTLWIMDPLIYHSLLKYQTFVCGRDLTPGGTPNPQIAALASDQILWANCYLFIEPSSVVYWQHILQICWWCNMCRKNLNCLTKWKRHQLLARSKYEHNIFNLIPVKPWDYRSSHPFSGYHRSAGGGQELIVQTPRPLFVAWPAQKH